MLCFSTVGACCLCLVVAVLMLEWVGGFMESTNGADLTFIGDGVELEP